MVRFRGVRHRSAQQASGTTVDSDLHCSRAVGAEKQLREEFSGDGFSCRVCWRLANGVCAFIMRITYQGPSLGPRISSIFDEDTSK
jgi:hypothetical protein